MGAGLSTKSVLLAMVSAIAMISPLAYISKRHTLLSYANPIVVCSCMYAFCLRIAIRHSMRTSGVQYIFRTNCNQNAYMHEQSTIKFCVRMVAGST